MGRRIDPLTRDPGARALPLRFEVTRKLIHLGSSVFPIAYATLLDRTTLLLVLGVATVVALVIELLRRYSGAASMWFERLTGFMLRDHEHAGSSTRWVGATWMLLAFTAVVALFTRPVAIAAMCAVSFGDGLAALVGRMAGRHAIGLSGKTVEGSVACLVATALAARFIAGLPLPVALLTGAFGAMAEIPSRPFDDNVRVAIAAALGAAAGVAWWG